MIQRASIDTNIEDIPSDSIKTKVRFSFLLLIWALSFFPIYSEMFQTWINHSDNSHGILVPFISTYFLWEKKAALAKIQISTSIWGGVILIISMALYLLSYAGEIMFIARCTIIFSLMGLILFCLGVDYFRQLSFPLFFLFFMVPLPHSLLSLVSFPLQLFATKVASFLIQLLPIPAYREGNMVYFASTQLEVAEACSGIRSLASLTMLSTLFAYVTLDGWVSKAIIVVSSLPVALFTNIFRITCTGILAHFWGDGVARGFLHDFSGIVVFLIGLFMLQLESSLLKRLRRSSEEKVHMPV